LWLKYNYLRFPELTGIFWFVFAKFKVFYNSREVFAKDIPEGTVVTHKLGERGFNEVMDFSESAIVYCNSRPYLLTIMTRGKDIKQQTALVREISGEIYNQYKDL